MVTKKRTTAIKKPQNDPAANQDLDDLSDEDQDDDLSQLFSLVKTCKQNGLEPPDPEFVPSIEQFMPWLWKAVD